MVKKLFFKIFFLFLSFTAPLRGADLTVSLALDDIHYLKDTAGKIKPTVFKGESFQLKVTVGGTSRSTSTPTISGIENFSMRGQKHHSNISINNASILAEKTTAYTLFPKKKGLFSLGPAKIEHEGKIYTSNTVTLHVAQQQEKKASQFAPRPQTKKTVRKKKAATKKTNANDNLAYELFCKTTANKKIAYTEEPINVSVRVYYRGGGLANIRTIMPPKFPDCTVKEVKKHEEYSKVIDEKAFRVLDKKFIIFPKKPGHLAISPAQVVYQIRKKRKHRPRRSFFDDAFFGNLLGADLHQKVTSSNSLALTIKEPPITSKRVDAIGRFDSFTAKIDKTTLFANEPIKLTLALTGEANFDLILPLKLTLPPLFKTYDSKTETKTGTKLFEYILQIPKAGTWTIPAQTITYFDTRLEQYQTLNTEPITVTVSLPEGHTAPTLPTEQAAIPQEAEQAVFDIHFIADYVPATQEPSQHLPLLLFLLLILLIPFLAYSKTIALTLLPLVGRILPFKKNILSAYQKKLTDMIEDNEVENLYALFMQFFAKIACTPPGAVNEGWIDRWLAQKGLGDEKRASLKTFLHECAQYSFAAKKIPQIDLQELYKRANYWLVLIYQHTK